MRMYDIISHKKLGMALSSEEILFFVDGFTKGEIPDYQAAALLMAICLNGMDENETAALTQIMAISGDVADLSSIPGIKVDKHSTGGVGDKTSLIVGPIVAAAGVPVAKMSGRGLGHSGGTVDKLESIPGLSMAIEPDRFCDIVRSVGLSIIGQSGDIAPADKKIYALRDVTATVESIPLIASSIMSKKLAAGSDAILLDVKTGSGAFMKTLDDSINLARAMVSIGNRNKRKTMALVTNMDVPLGNAVGNALEVTEAVNTLRAYGPKDLTDICIELAAYMLFLANAEKSLEKCRLLANRGITSGRAFAKLCQMVVAQGGDSSVLHDGFKKAEIISPYIATQSGYISHMDAEAVGLSSLALGAGRATMDDEIDYLAGIMLNKKTGDFVEAGDVLAYLHTSDEKSLVEAEELLNQAYSIEDELPLLSRTILAVVSEDGVKKL